MRVNIYAEELTERVTIVEKVIDGEIFTAVRFYTELPVTLLPQPADVERGARPINVRGPFLHRPGDDDSSAVTFWGKQDFRGILRKALGLLDEYYAHRGAESSVLGIIHNAYEPPSLDVDNLPRGDGA